MMPKKRIQQLRERIEALEELLDVQDQTVLQQAQILNDQLSRVKRAHDELKMTIEDAGKSLEHTREFFTNMSHEVRTPMNAIIGMTSLCMDSDIRKDQFRYLEIVQKNAWSLLDIMSKRLNDSSSLSLRLQAQDKNDLN